MENIPIENDAHDLPTKGVNRFDYPNNKPAYTKKLTILSNISEKNQVDHIAAIDWYSPEYEVREDDERWILPRGFDIAAHPWFWEQPVERQIEISKYRGAQISKVGSQFEKVLIRGIKAFNTRPGNTEEENIYSRHEAQEEVGHIRMFEKFVSLAEPDVKGAPAWFHAMSPLVVPTAKYLPIAFWSLVLAGEEPIDRTQRSLLDRAKRGTKLHPMLHDVMQLHVEEEARHISFAHMYLERHVDPRRTDKKSRAEHLALAAMYPVFMRVFADVILRPSKQSIKDMGIPKEIANEVWWNSDSGKESLRDLFPNARRQADKLQLRRSKLGRGIWRILEIEEQSENLAA